ncbi:MAG: hypothetical protein A2073_07275 [Deltaproteobacteria bacterium GWC2_42_11]|nr:MAG: hypothetical protein A2073_07275 [Deltaproteobacteria bacterium GWC2_42_11]
MTKIFIESILKNMGTAQAKIKGETSDTHQLLNLVLKEIRSLRQEFYLLLPQEDIEEYAYPERIKRSYQKALKKYPPI